MPKFEKVIDDEFGKLPPVQPSLCFQQQNLKIQWFQQQKQRSWMFWVFGGNAKIRQSNGNLLNVWMKREVVCNFLGGVLIWKYVTSFFVSEWIRIVQKAIKDFTQQILKNTQCTRPIFKESKQRQTQRIKFCMKLENDPVIFYKKFSIESSLAIDWLTSQLTTETNFVCGLFGGNNWSRWFHSRIKNG